MISASIGHYVYKTAQHTKSIVFLKILLAWSVLVTLVSFKENLIGLSLGYTNTLPFVLILERALDHYRETKPMTGEDS